MPLRERLMSQRLDFHADNMMYLSLLIVFRDCVIVSTLLMLVA
jgi:hypothetical protein